MDNFDIMFHDLTDEAQKRLLAFEGINDECEMNWDVFPIVVLSRPEDDE